MSRDVRLAATSRFCCLIWTANNKIESGEGSGVVWWDMPLRVRRGMSDSCCES